MICCFWCISPTAETTNARSVREKFLLIPAAFTCYLPLLLRASRRSWREGCDLLADDPRRFTLAQFFRDLATRATEDLAQRLPLLRCRFLVVPLRTSPKDRQMLRDISPDESITVLKRLLQGFRRGSNGPAGHRARHIELAQDVFANFQFLFGGQRQYETAINSAMPSQLGVQFDFL